MSVPSEMVNTTGNMSTLTFDPLATSHAGNYTCVVTALVDKEMNVTEMSTLYYIQIGSKLLFSSMQPLIRSNIADDAMSHDHSCIYIIQLA